MIHFIYLSRSLWSVVTHVNFSHHACSSSYQKNKGTPIPIIILRWTGSGGRSSRSVRCQVQGDGPDSPRRRHHGWAEVLPERGQAVPGPQPSECVEDGRPLPGDQPLPNPSGGLLCCTYIPYIKFLELFTTARNKIKLVIVQNDLNN